MNEHTYNTVLENLHRWESFSQEKQAEVATHLQALLLALEDEQNRLEHVEKDNISLTKLEMDLQKAAEAFFTMVLKSSSALTTHNHWQDPTGAWSDLPETLLEDLEELRHSNPPTPPIEDL